MDRWGKKKAEKDRRWCEGGAKRPLVAGEITFCNSTVRRRILIPAINLETGPSITGLFERSWHLFSLQPPPVERCFSLRMPCQTTRDRQLRSMGMPDTDKTIPAMLRHVPAEASPKVTLTIDLYVFVLVTLSKLCLFSLFFWL